MDLFGISALLIIYSILCSRARHVRLFPPRGITVSIKLNQFTMRWGRARYTHIFYMLIRAYATRSYDIGHIYYEAAGATARYDRRGSGYLVRH